MLSFNRWPTLLVLTLPLLVALGMFFQTTVSAQQTGGAPAGNTGGAPAGGAGAATENPFDVGDQEAVAAGQALFTGKLGCYGCHGREGGGGMGPSLVDAQWIYGDSDAELFESIHSGRPNGMPAFADAATDEEIWQVVTFLRSLNAGSEGQ